MISILKKYRQLKLDRPDENKEILVSLNSYGNENSILINKDDAIEIIKHLHVVFNIPTLKDFGNAKITVSGGHQVPIANKFIRDECGKCGGRHYYNNNGKYTCVKCLNNRPKNTYVYNYDSTTKRRAAEQKLEEIKLSRELGA